MSTDLSIVIHDPAQIELLIEQTIESAILIAYGPASHDRSVRDLATSKGWKYQQRNSLSDAVRFSKTSFMVEWCDIYDPAPGLLADLVSAAKEHPLMLGAIAPNFDGVLVWRTAALRDRRGAFKEDPALTQRH